MKKLLLTFLLLTLPARAALYLESTDSLEVITSAAVNVDYTVSWADITTTTFVPSKSAGQITTATTTTVLAAPAASTQRSIGYVTIRNLDAVTSNDITVQRDVSATNRVMWKGTLAAGESLDWKDAEGWVVYSTTGVRKASGTVDDDSVTNAKLAEVAANTMKGNFTASTANPTDTALAANQFFARSNSGNIVAKSATDFGLSQIDDADASAGRTTLGLGTMATQAGSGAAKRIATWVGATDLTSDTDFTWDATLTPKRLLVNGELVLKGGPVANVKAYGATGDSSTDDTSFINSAIAACNAYLAPSASQRGCIVYFPPGIYKTGAWTAVSGNGIVLQGAGRGATTIYVSSATADIVTFASASEFNEVRDMQFFNQATRTAGAYINTSGANDLIIENFGMSGYFTGISVSGGSASAGIKNYIRTGVIDSAAQTTSVGISVVNGAAGDTYISDIIMSNGGTVPLAGIRLQQTGHTSIHNVNITGADTGLLIDPATSQDVTYVYVDTSLFDSCVTNGMKINPANAASARVRSLKFVNTWFSGSTVAAGVGINFTTQGASAIVDDLEFIGVRILNNKSHGISLGFGTNIRFRGGTIAGNSTNSAFAADGVNVAAAVSEFSFDGVRIGPVGTATNTQRWGINIVAGASTNFRVTNNDLRGNGSSGTASGPMTDASTGAARVKYISGNLGLMPDSIVSTAVSATITTTATIFNQTPSIPFGALQVGTTCIWEAEGSISASGTVTVAAKIGTAGSCTATDVTLSSTAIASAAAGGVSAHGMFTVRTIGAAGSAIGNHRSQAAAVVTPLSNNVATVAVNTQVANFVELCGTASAGNLTFHNARIACAQQ